MNLARNHRATIRHHEIALLVTGAIFLPLTSGCDILFPGLGQGRVTVTYDFADGAQGWSAAFAEYGTEQEDIVETLAEIRPLPEEIDPDANGFYLQSMNRSDDLFMFLYRSLGPDDGIVPNATYIVRLTITFASNAPSNCVGIGGAPGEGVYLKAGATRTEPKVSLVNGFYEVNVDKGNQSQGGPAASVVGHIANGISCETIPDLDQAPFVSLRREHLHTPSVTADPDGVLWIMVGTDSAFEGLTTLYYQTIRVDLVPTIPIQ